MSKLSIDEKNLIRRYMIWFYKAAQEECDKVDRKFTQLKVDYHVLTELSKKKPKLAKRELQIYSNLISDFKSYINKKENGAYESKFLDAKKTTLKPEYAFLKNRIKAIENAIVFFLGKKELTKIKSMYQDEMAKRILESREH